MNCFITKPQGDILLLVVKSLQFFSEATNILQGESATTANRVIPVIDSFQNALLQTTCDNAGINAFCKTSIWLSLTLKAFSSSCGT